ncbi:hypothetical protein DFH09DRAFT_951401 [Mycena vulgaris]|nr:hypothetical protein DFH09DRAFT_951401 [Mycena vulgaris]
MCTKCSPPVAFDITHPQTVLTHMGAHILHDSTINRSDQPCGLCGRPSPMCSFVLKKTLDGVAIDFKKSQGCPNFIKKFNYGVAAKSGTKSPCSNVPLRCPECDSDQPTVWRYNLKYHLMHFHPRASVANHKDLWEINPSELATMRAVWERLKEPRKKTAKKRLNQL